MSDVPQPLPQEESDESATAASELRLPFNHTDVALPSDSWGKHVFSGVPLKVAYSVCLPGPDMRGALMSLVGVDEASNHVDTLIDKEKLDEASRVLDKSELGDHIYPQGSVLSPFLFNLVLAALPAALPVDRRYPTQCSLYADDVALWPVAVITDSRPALQALQSPEKSGITVALLHAKLTAIRAHGVRLSLHWLPSHVGIAGNEAADVAAKAAHSSAPITTAVAASDYTRLRLRQLLLSMHPDKRVASGKPPPPLPETGLEGRERWLLLRLRTGSAWPATRKYVKGRCSSTACSRCGSNETLYHTLCCCPALAAERRLMVGKYRRQGLPSNTAEDILFTAHHPLPAFRALLEFAEPAGLYNI
ncbi:hypothetical protein HPB50_014402 [Hyalomma asiaticum]|uniref:Uncharacterized protein n=1 Tax=Hyalomma asiaticum TaxID=266040 RepID=A0ACB7THJ5_HYAAI|nr:hypothetical protein HPB50_014402 [Hyalomma asiaticum]